MSERSLADPPAFWAAEAEELEWFRKWDRVLDDSQRPFFKWFVGGQVNIVHNAIDRHLHTYRKNKLALIWESEDGKQHETYSYYAMNREVSRMANIIKAMGIRKGDRVTIYLGRDSADRFRHAGVRQDRCSSLRGLWRFFRGFAPGPD